MFRVSSALPPLKCVHIMNGAGQIDLSLIPPAQVLDIVPALRDKCLTGSKCGMLDQRRNTLTRRSKCAAGTDMVQKQISKNLRGSVVIVKERWCPLPKHERAKRMTVA